MCSFGKCFLSAVLAEKSVSNFVGLGNISHLFQGTETEVANFISGFVKQHAQLPAPETVQLHTGEALAPMPEPSSYYLDLLEARHVEREVKKALHGANEKLKSQDPFGAKDLLRSSIMSLTAQSMGKQIADFRHSYDAVKAGKDPLPPKIGSRLFVSMEMASLPIQQRLAAFVAQVEPIKLKKGALSSIGVTNMKNGLTRIQHYGSPFYVVDGNLTATVEDIWALARQLDVEAILIDGGYLIKHPTERDRFRRVAENAELIKKELCPLAPTIVSWQFASSATKKKKGEKADLDDIGYTDAIAQVSSLVLGLLEKDTIETLKQRSIEILKGRNGETGSFNTAWEFDKMNFTQIIETPVKEFQFL
jgi:hypothetical protein